MTGPDEKPPTIDVALVRRLVAAQFPGWSDLDVRPVRAGGWDNRTFHLGDTMTVRLPSAPGYVPQVDKEQRWLPRLAPGLPLAVPAPLARGVPGEGYPFPWSVYAWIEGRTATLDQIADPVEFAVDLAGFLTALHRPEPAGGPLAGAHSAFRGAPLSTYDDDTRRAVRQLADRGLAVEATAIWAEALASTWAGPPVWFHGDVAVGNLLVREGRLAAVIDFGCCGMGDPACDLTVAWTLLPAPAREAFRAALPYAHDTWARARGWALWKALITRDDPEQAATARSTLDAIRVGHR
ncbi:aminoglycoside phosphotransferase family protein [Micromonospora mirobrigensis]|uniref:Predicted kinase, aminoglycoside phosphotransferase (APT) family n=1 Tax=Micromonospora mirobrigensis TaxID=262898 RepID=A0A1C4WLB4_9ACTN|nr:aminoglycoside phosphotransferase family protein [Micromonospora mirobrigensis]SCE96681.1 Predicted kinase, aminoglycoside phosphotransferase (APT) family [Micromonospora mirobrigensis]